MRGGLDKWITILAIPLALSSTCSYGVDSAFLLNATDEELTHEVSRLLGVPPDANESEFKKAYRKKAMELHADRMIGRSPEEKTKAEAELKEILSAYKALLDRKRKNSPQAISLEQVFQDLESGEKSRILRGLELVTERNSEIERLDRKAHNNHQGVRLIDAYDQVIKGLGPSTSKGEIAVQDGIEDHQVFEALIRSVMRTFYVWEQNPLTDQVEILWANTHMMDVDPFPASSYIESAVEAGIKRGWKLEDICQTLEKNNASLGDGFPDQILKAWVSVHQSNTPEEFESTVRLLEKTWKRPRTISKKSSNTFIQCVRRFFNFR